MFSVEFGAENGGNFVFHFKSLWVTDGVVFFGRSGGSLNAARFVESIHWNIIPSIFMLAFFPYAFFFCCC
jgi:hypothetical protein